MAKKKATTQKIRAEKTSKTENKETETLAVLKNKIKSTNKNKNKKRIDDVASDEEALIPVVPSSSEESGNDDVRESSEDRRSSTDEDDEKEEKVVMKKKGKIEKVKIKKEKKRKNEDEEEESEEKSETTLYRFAMNRVSRIIRSDNSNLKISQEAVFLINKASEKFLELFSKEAYANAFLDRKNYVCYNHLSSVVSKRRRFDFLSDFVPEKVKAEDALNKMSEAEK
ncbi:hypothetical protein ACJIZ3_017976 [Penstemon smallii]|uniref:Transcription factor CBF/NF-Y/archaeal histone domain-containing protein n=1 Tax=Penstemon smallii TaxID=265156 RepID=A0ABD3SX37_9LAMI